MGSLKERDGMYTAILNVYDETGKRKQKTACSAYSGERQQAKARRHDERLLSSFSYSHYRSICANIRVRLRKSVDVKRSNV